MLEWNVEGDSSATIQMVSSKTDQKIAVVCGTSQANTDGCTPKKVTTMPCTAARVLLVFGLTPMLFYAQTNEEAALTSFKALVSRHIDSYKPNGRVRVRQVPGGWIRERFTLDPASAKFDVEKTSSLVSPFVATLSFTLIWSVTAVHPAEAAAAADNTFVAPENLSITVHKHEFAYQDQKWQPKSRTYRLQSGLVGGDLPCDEFLLKKEKPAEEDIHGCLEEFDDDVR